MLSIMLSCVVNAGENALAKVGYANARMQRYWWT
jgi:hypothetical protein